MAIPRLVAVGAEQPVPPGQVEAEIAVGLARMDRVMHPMHVGRDDQPAHQLVEGRQHAHIAMIEHGGGVEQDFKNDHGERWRTKRRYDGQLDGCR